MRKCLQLFVLLGITSLPGMSAVMTWYADLLPQNELHTVNLNGATPGGFGTVSFDNVTNILTVNFTWQGLTDDAMAAHIHCCVANPPGTAGVALGFWNPPPGPARPSSGSYSNSWDLDTENPFTNATFVANNGGTPLAAFLTALMPAMNAGTPELGRAYINIHTMNNPAGEIRGNLAPIPEPGTVALVMAGLGLLVFRRRS